MPAIRSLLEAEKYIDTIITLTASIDDATGKLSNAFMLGETGHDAFIIELLAFASGATDALDWAVLYSLDGTNYTNAVFKGVTGDDNGTIANTATPAKYWVKVFVDRPCHSAKLFVSSAGGTNTWTVTARVRRVRTRNST